MHNIIVFGGAGRTGALVVRQALKQGHNVTVFTHNQPQPDVLPGTGNLHVVVADARQPLAVLQALTGHNVVINVIAPKLFDSKNYDISQVATANIIAGMQKTGAKRYIGQSGAWATDQLSDASLPMRIAFKVIPQFKQIYAYKQKEDELVKNSGLNFTLVRCGLLTNKVPISNYRIFMERYKCGILEMPKIRRLNVADFELSIIDKAVYVGKCPIVIE